jgi:CHC2 zinc finger
MTATTAFRSHADRDAIKAPAEADFLNLFEEHGGRRRGKVLHCLFHEDRNPSASIHNGRFRCFTCNLSLDVFGFIEKAQGTDFRGALSYLADRYGVPLNNRVLTDSEKREYAEAQRIREEAAYFADAAALMAEWALEELPPEDPERAGHTALIVALRVSPESEYRTWLTRDPQKAAGLVHAGRERERRLQVALAEWIAGGMSGVMDAA